MNNRKRRVTIRMLSYLLAVLMIISISFVR